jgi:hypothetical protein
VGDDVLSATGGEILVEIEDWRLLYIMIHYGKAYEETIVQKKIHIWFTLVHIVSLIEFDVSLHDTPWKNICESAMRCPKICRQSMTKPLTSGAHSLPFCGSDVDAVCGNCENRCEWLWYLYILFIKSHGSVITCDAYVEYHDDDRSLCDLEYHLRSLKRPHQEKGWESHGQFA